MQKLKAGTKDNRECEMKSMEARNKGLIIFGIILLVIGLVAYLYGYPLYRDGSGPMVYPYQNIGILLAVAGIVFMALGFLYSPRKTPPPPPK
jgi:drug/metabolite transporter (DMT)-like permease